MGARWSWALLVVTAGCGRIGYDERARTVDASPVVDAPIDAPATCPADMAEIPMMTGVVAADRVCIERAERGNAPWTTAKADCEALGRRLCADAEWYDGCVNAPGLMSMTDGYEWVAEEVGGVAQKRGSSGCDDSSSHAVVDPYQYRCCLTL